MYSYVARQPILDIRKDTIGYELLFRDGPKNSFPDIEHEIATTRLLSEQFLSSYCNPTGNKLAFVNFPYKSLIKLQPSFFQKNSFIIEILEDCKPTDELLNAVMLLSEKGYKLALDDFIPDPSWKRFLPYINIIKFDIQDIPMERARFFIHHFRHHHGYKVKFLAEKVETYEEFLQAKDIGFDYFQGYFFSKPEMLKQRAMDTYQLAVLRLCEEISVSDVDYSVIEELIANDVSLSFKLLRYVNSSSFITQPISSFKQALVYLGQEKLRYFIYLVAVTHAGQNKPPSLYTLSIQRARICELLVSRGSWKTKPSQAFIMGMFSLLESLLDRPLPLLLDHLPICDEVKLALIEGKGELGHLLNAVQAYEQADWEQVSYYCKVFNISEELIANQYAKSVQWVDSFTI